MGLLDLIAAPSPERAKQTLADLVRGPQNRLRGLLDSPVSFLTDALNDVVPTGQQAAEQLQRYQLPMSQDYAMGPSGYDNKLKDMALAGLTVYHGSPHKFDKFDMSKIGTGEGAQAYGHGLYFAESPEVAVAYRNKLATDSSLLNPKVVTFKDGSQVDVGTSGWALNMLKKGNMDAQEARAAIETELKDAAYLKNYKAMEQAKSALKALDDGAFEISGVNAGQLYKVDLPDESIAKMLDWDKPLSQQAPEVRAALESHQAYPAIKAWLNAHLSNAPKGTEATGQAINEVLAGKLGGQQAVSNLLKSQGIPGIRYLDGSSRSAGSGTSNYVVFDDSLLKILERNGMPVP